MVQDLYILMITAAVVSILFKLLKQPVVLGYIVAGVLVGPHLFGKSLVNADNVKAWGDIGGCNRCADNYRGHDALWLPCGSGCEI